ncbi:MAG: hypothetical protein N3B21_12845 [Clostridia bacterium]|nr:hypothetical protein [Clostridia bacterium]
MRDLKNCKTCGKLFSPLASTTHCNSCSTADERVFKMIREYLYDNPGTNAYDLCVRFNVSIERIIKYIKDDRLKVM